MKVKKDSFPPIKIGEKNGNIPIHGKLVINIKKLQEDIAKSINDPIKGYIADLKKRRVRRYNFKKAIKSIYKIK